MLLALFLVAILASGVCLVPTTLGVSLAKRQECCGFIVTNRNNSYFSHKHIADFASMTSVSQVQDAGWIIADGWQAGGENPVTGQIPIGNPANVYIVNGEGLALNVPHQDKNAPTLSVAEVQFPDATLGGIFEVTTKLVSIPGTCMGIFTSHADAGLDRPLGWHDEQDIEMLGASLLVAQTKPFYQPAGIQMLNYRPSDGAKSPSGSAQPFPAGVDPSKAYHTFSLSWYPQTSSNNPSKPTEYRFDGTLLSKAPKVYSSINPSTLVINHWTNADAHWSAGPPAQDAIMYVKRVVAYYDTAEAIKSGTGVEKGTCDRGNACKVTV